MKITADTNLLVRAVMQDDLRQSQAAEAELENAKLVILTLPALCELVWVLSKLYKKPSTGIAMAVRRLVNGANVAVNMPAVEAGLAMMEAGADFADGVIAYEGNWLGGETFASFDKQAVKSLAAQGIPARLLA